VTADGADPAPRGRYGDGAWRKLPSGKWLLTFNLGRTPAGGRRRRSVSGSTKRECREKRSELEQQAAGGTLPARRQGQRLLSAWLREWLEGKRGTIEPSTWSSYRVCVETRLVPFLGGLRLAEVEPADVRRALAALADRGLSPRSRELTRVTLAQALGQAVRDGLLVRNVCDAVDPPKVPRREARALTAPEIAALLGHARGDWRALWLLALHSGMREGELLGLTWSDVSLERASGGVVVVQRALVDGPDGLPQLRDAPKSRAGIRRVPIGREVAVALEEHRRGQAAERLRSRVWGDDAGLVFLSSRGTPLLRANVGRVFRAHCAGAGVTRRPREGLHLLRHTYASHLLAQGRPLTEVAYLLGHATPAITLAIYAHFIPGSGSEAPAALARAYGALPPASPA
jgi:integrase